MQNKIGSSREKSYFSVALVAVVLGILLAIQFRTTSAPAVAPPLNREHELAAEKKNLEKELSSIRDELVDLSNKLEQAGSGQGDAGEVLEKELFKIRRFAGLVPLSGPGVEMLLQNPSRQASLGSDQNLKSVTDEDLLKIVNSLRTSGAEAIAINGQRIMTTTEIRLAGSHINVNATPLSPPYQINAIGDQLAMISRLEIRDGHVEFLRESGIMVSLQAKENVEIPAFKGLLNFTHARNMDKGDPAEPAAVSGSGLQ